MDDKEVDHPDPAEAAAQGELVLYKHCTSSYHEGPRELPATDEFYYRRASGHLGFSSICKVCHVKQVADVERRKRELLESGGVQAVVKLARQEKTVPHMTELLEELYDQAGGTKALVTRFWEDYLSSTPGSPHRLRSMEAIFRMTVQNTQDGHSDKPMELWTEQELTEYIEGQLPKVMLEAEERAKDGRASSGKSGNDKEP